MQKRLDDPLSTEPSVVQTSNFERRPVAQCGARALPWCNGASRGPLKVTKRDTPESRHVVKQRRKKKQHLAQVHSFPRETLVLTCLDRREEPKVSSTLGGF
jgi:hypothetical protein